MGACVACTCLRHMHALVFNALCCASVEQINVYLTHAFPSVNTFSSREQFKIKAGSNLKIISTKRLQMK